MTNISQQSKIAETQIEGVTRFTCGDITIYRIVLESLAKHYTNTHLILDGEATLIDTGFDSYKGRDDLEKGFEVINREFKENISLDEAKNIVITHTHQDHFGMLAWDRLKGKKLYVHELDSEWITSLEECNSRWGKELEKLGKEAGWEMSMQIPPTPKRYSVSHQDYQIIEVKEGDRIINGYTVFHTPGHTPGQICLKVGEVILLGDHVLPSMVLHQAPRSTGGAGFQAYLSSLRKAADLGSDIGLPSHEGTIYSIKEKVKELEGIHQQRLDDILKLCGEEKGLGQITREYFESYPGIIKAAYGQNVKEDTRWLLSLEFIMAHLEYLMDNNLLERTETNKGEIRYRAVL